MRRRRRPDVLLRPELDDEALHRTLAELRPGRQMHGLATERTRPPWQSVSDLLRGTGPDWDRRVHRIAVLAYRMPVSWAERWVERRPDDPDGWVVRAYVFATRASLATDRTAAAKAAEACYVAGEAYPQDPTPWIALLSLLRVHGAQPHHAREVWDEVVARDPWNRAAHHQMLHYLSPRECGSLAAMSDFAASSAGSAPPGSPLAVLPLTARAEHYARRLGASELLTGGHWHGRHIDQEIDHALDRWFHTRTPPHAGAMADLNVLAFALIRTLRLREAAPVFRRIGPHMTLFPWETAPDPIGSFRYWSRSLSGYSRGDAP